MTAWYPCEQPERPFDDDVRFHEPVKVFMSSGPGDPGTLIGHTMSVIIDGEQHEAKFCHGCDTARAANMHRLAARARAAAAGMAKVGEAARQIETPQRKEP